MTRNNAARTIAETDVTVPEPARAPQLQPYHYKPGQSGNPAGRPRGARSKLAELTLQKLLADFEEFGTEAIVEVRKKSPANYLAAVVSLLPKQQEKIESPLIDLSDEELAQLELWLAASRAKNVTIDADANEIMRQNDIEKGRTTATEAHLTKPDQQS